MAQASQAGASRENRLAAVLHWVTAPLAIPVLTGLNFVATTVFAYVLCRGDYGHGSYGIHEALPMAIFCLCVGVPLGYYLRWGVECELHHAPGLIRALLVVGVVWVGAFVVQAVVFWALIMSF
jgi:hypothetical protein